jgi:putative endonuclease
MRVKDAVGRFGEEVAAELLLARGLQILERNWRCAAGELDIVAQDGATLVFVEVKTRSSRAFGVPAEAVDGRKAARIRRLAGQWITAQRAAERQAEHSELTWSAVRFDVVAVVRDRDARPGDVPDVEHLVGVF